GAAEVRCPIVTRSECEEVLAVIVVVETTEEADNSLLCFCAGHGNQFSSRIQCGDQVCRSASTGCTQRVDLAIEVAGTHRGEEVVRLIETRLVVDDGVQFLLVKIGARRRGRPRGNEYGTRDVRL